MRGLGLYPGWDLRNHAVHQLLAAQRCIPGPPRPSIRKKTKSHYPPHAHCIVRLTATHCRAFAGMQVYFAGCLFSWVPWVSILPDLIVEEQRGRASGINSFVISFVGIIG